MYFMSNTCSLFFILWVEFSIFNPFAFSARDGADGGTGDTCYPPKVGQQSETLPQLSKEIRTRNYSKTCELIKMGVVNLVGVAFNNFKVYV